MGMANLDVEAGNGWHGTFSRVERDDEKVVLRMGVGGDVMDFEYLSIV